MGLLSGATEAVLIKNTCGSFFVTFVKSNQSYREFQRVITPQNNLFFNKKFDIFDIKKMLPPRTVKETHLQCQISEKLFVSKSTIAKFLKEENILRTTVSLNEACSQKF